MKAEMRWDYLKEIRMNNKANEPHIQPMSLGMIGREENDIQQHPTGKLFSYLAGICMITQVENESPQPPNEKLDPVLVALNSSRVLMTYFKLSMEAVVKKLNTASSVQELNLPNICEERLEDMLDFSPDLLVGDERIALSFGPVKKPERVHVKMQEYQDEIAARKKHASIGTRSLSGIDYVLDWMRSTVKSEDPYVLYIFYQLLKQSPHFKIQRVKNKFQERGKDPSDKNPTNVLINLILLYPPTEECYQQTKLSKFGPFEDSRVGEELTSCEVQLTLKDFHTIKELQHIYYDVDRSKDENFILWEPIFLSKDTLEKKDPSVLKDLN
eukprot:CAMPEP_0194317132 /NCGR_PEP_ID=MMETSP0171-20130528/13886_1 /TAXON_ID=218684 /ORGANISM="Corethron pennatum, Strain L29A3" /LENGTH=326 /DNA_ID=CAMNT_0039073621 /DNA_START=133 /DNA_END=1113 /DNA_ORIENTATION=+